EPGLAGRAPEQAPGPASRNVGWCIRLFSAARVIPGLQLTVTGHRHRVPLPIGVGHATTASLEASRAGGYTTFGVCRILSGISWLRMVSSAFGFEGEVMAARLTVNLRDLRTLLDIVTVGRSDHCDRAPPGLPPSMLADLLEQVGGDCI